MASAAPKTLVDRYSSSDLALFDAEDRRRFLAEQADWKVVGPQLAWEVLYRKEPELFQRLIAGESIHPAVIDALPPARTVVELAAGSGRLTEHLADRYEKVIAVEPVSAMRSMIEAKAWRGVETRRGYFDAIPAPDDSADLVVSCSAFTSEAIHGGEEGLAEMERVVAPGGTIALVWPVDVDWLRRRGFAYRSFEAEMDVDFGTIEEAVELAQIFYPKAVQEITERGSARVPYALLGMNPPRDLAYKRMP